MFPDNVPVGHIIHLMMCLCWWAYSEPL
jgi:hypothetical protein